MNKEFAAPLTPALNAASSLWLRSAGIALAASAFVAICAHVAFPLPFTPVPFTVGPFAVLLLALVLSPRMAAAALAAYLAEGAAGLPVFAPSPLGSGGLAHLLGPTGGYLFAYPFAAALVAYLFRRGKRSTLAALFSAAAGNVIILLCGALWLVALTHASAAAAFALGILPFLPGDAIKVIAAAGFGAGFQRLRRQTE
jgi:biotin transport system substrate-specific component